MKKCPFQCHDCPVMQENRKLKEKIALLENEETARYELERANRKFNSARAKIKDLEQQLEESNQEIKDIKADFNEAVREAKNEAEKRATVEIASQSMKSKEELRKTRQKYEDKITVLAEEKKTAEENLSKTQVALEKLQSQLNKDSHNSGKPSSTDGFKTPIRNNRPASDKKAGGQVGHAATNLTYLEPDTVTIISDSEFAQNPERYKSTGEMKTKQRVSVEIVFHVAEYKAPVYYDRELKRYVHPAFPADLVNQVTYDGSMEAFAMLLHTYANVSYDKVREIFNDLSQGRVHPSKAWLAGLEKQFQAKTEEDRKKITEAILKSPYAHTDCTAIKVNGENMCVLTVTCPEGTMYYFSEHKGFQATEFSLLPEFKGTLIHDGEQVFFNYGLDHQLCLVHELRYLIGASETEKGITWLKQMHDLLQKADHLANEAKRNGESHISDKEIQAIREEYDRLIQLGKDEYAKKTIGYFDEGKRILKRLDKNRNFYLNFLSDLTLPAVNNAAELALRGVKLHFKNGSQPKSEGGALAFTNTWSVVQSRRKQGESMYLILNEVFNTPKSKLAASA